MRSSRQDGRRWPGAVAAQVRCVERWLRPHVVPARRDFLHGGYAKSRSQWMGVPVPAMRALARDLDRRLKDEPPRAVIALVLALARCTTIECRLTGYELLARRDDAMAALRRADIDRLGRGNDNWAAVDTFATLIAGPAWLVGIIRDVDVRRWAAASDPWWRRTAIVSTVPLNLRSRGGRGDARRTLMICRRFAAERDPMLAKALSWALRSLVPHDPSAVRAFLEDYASTLPAIVRREVSAKLEIGKKRVANVRRRRLLA
jgi:3-methyladenine DNA glycosylase AlkD